MNETRKIIRSRAKAESKLLVPPSKPDPLPNPSSLLLAPPAGNAPCGALVEVVTIVRARRGTLSFFVRRIEAEVACRADLSARWSEVRGTSRFMTFWAADWIV